MSTLDSLECQQSLSVNGEVFQYASLVTAQSAGLSGIDRLPFSLKVLLENILRHEDGQTVTVADLHAMADWLQHGHSRHEIAFHPARVLMQDFTGVPAVADLAAMRDAMQALGGDPAAINPLTPVDLVIDHSVQVDQFAQSGALAHNVTVEMTRNAERYAFLRWGQSAFKNFRVVPPGNGICHQVNLEHLARGVWQKSENNKTFIYSESMVGTDSHSTMINGLGVLGWGVGGIEAEAAMLGQPISMLIPDVIGFRFNGRLPEGVTATDLVLTVTQRLREYGVVGKFVEFFGPALHTLSLADRATIANMAPEYGATCGFFPIDQETIRYLALTGRDTQTIALVEAYCKAQGLWHDAKTPDPIFTDVLELQLDSVQPSLAGPKRPQDKVSLAQLPHATDTLIQANSVEDKLSVAITDSSHRLTHGDVVIAAITSCTNTSNPSVLMAAGLLAQRACERGLVRKPWVKSSLAPGSKVVTEYLKQAGLLPYLEQLGFHVVGYGCTTCIGNSGPLPEAIDQAIADGQLVVSAVLSGNRNFEGRIHPRVKANWLASPPLVVAYALAGTTRIDLSQDPLGEDHAGQPVTLKDIWPSNAEVATAVAAVNREMFQQEYAEIFEGDAHWSAFDVPDTQTYPWQMDSTYVQPPPFFRELADKPEPIQTIDGAYCLALLGDSITTDHISPAGAIAVDSPAGQFLRACGVAESDFNSYGARRGNHDVMVRGTFANIRIRNAMLPGTEGGVTQHIPSGDHLSIFDAAERYRTEGHALVVIAGKEYGTGSSRDWAAKGTRLLGVRAVLAESFERIHRSNLIGMGVLPLQFTGGQNAQSLALTGQERFTLRDLNALTVGQSLTAELTRPDGSQDCITLQCRIDTANELSYFQHGGILAHVLRHIRNKSA